MCLFFAKTFMKIEKGARNFIQTILESTNNLVFP